MSDNLKSAVNIVGDLPPMPMVAVKVVEIIQNPNSNAEQLAQAVALDPAVSARVLKIANSSFYSLQRQVRTLEHAVVILGEKTLKSLVFAACLKEVHKSFGLMEKMLWEDAIGCALACRMLAQKLRSCDPEEAFLAGLMRHIGKSIMNNLDPDKYRSAVEAAYSGEGSLDEMERRFFPYTHTDIGALVLQKWNFSEALIAVARHHTDLDIDRADDPALFQLCATVNLADRFCRRLGIGQRTPLDELDLPATPGAKALQLDSERLDELLKEFQTVFAQDSQAFLE